MTTTQNKIKNDRSLEALIAACQIAEYIIEKVKGQPLFHPLFKSKRRKNQGEMLC